MLNSQAGSWSHFDREFGIAESGPFLPHAQLNMQQEIVTRGSHLRHLREREEELRIRRRANACLFIGRLRVGEGLGAVLASVKDCPSSSISLHIAVHIHEGTVYA